jgi:hypothetical protein
MVLRQHIVLAHGLGEAHGFFLWFLIHGFGAVSHRYKEALSSFYVGWISMEWSFLSIFASVLVVIVGSTIYVWMIDFLVAHRRDLLQILEESSSWESKWLLDTWRGISSC